MGQELAKHPLINYHKIKVAPPTPPAPFPELVDKRPLAGIKVIELGRVIALPATGIVLTSFGAEVVRVQSKDLPDFSVSHPAITLLLTMSHNQYSQPSCA